MIYKLLYFTYLMLRVLRKFPQQLKVFRIYIRRKYLASFYLFDYSEILVQIDAKNPIFRIKMCSRPVFY
jgi:hypothetical protein